MKKICNKCGIIRDIIEFAKSKKSKCGLSYWCKGCYKLYKLKNKDKIKIQNKILRLKRKKEIKAYFIINQEKINKRRRRYFSNNREKINIKRRPYKRKWMRDKCKNIEFKIFKNCRKRIWYSLKNFKKNDSTHNLLNKNGIEYKKYIESLFYNNMTWECHGVGPGKWQIHHICPIEFFNLTDHIEQKQAFHYTNTKPLWYEDHMEEHRKINERMKSYNNDGNAPWQENII